MVGFEGVDFISTPDNETKQQILDDYEKARKYEDLMEKVIRRIEANKKQSQIEHERGDKGFAYDLDLFVKLLEGIRDDKFYYGETNKRNQKLRELIEKTIEWITKNDNDGSWTITYQELKRILEESNG